MYNSIRDLQFPRNSVIIVKRDRLKMSLRAAPFFFSSSLTLTTKHIINLQRIREHHLYKIYY